MNKKCKNINRNKGFTIVELLVSFSLTMVVIIYLLRTIIVISNKENDLLTLQEYIVVETNLLDEIYKDMKGLNSKEYNVNEIMISDGRNAKEPFEGIAIEPAGIITFDIDNNSIIYKDVIYELPEGVKFNKNNLYSVNKIIDGCMISGNNVFYVAKINLLVNDKEKSINIVKQQSDVNYIGTNCNP